jgi:hypothetical protein
VQKGEDEYMIVVSGVKDTGLCGGYWGNTDNLSSRRRSKQPETFGWSWGWSWGWAKADQQDHQILSYIGD